MIPAYAGNMRVVVGGMIDTDEEKEWLRELREWRATNLVSSSTQADAVDGSLIVLPELTAVVTGRRSTTKPKELWAMHLTQMSVTALRPRAPLGTSTESDWNDLVRTLDDHKFEIRAWVDESLELLRRRTL